MLKIRDQYDIYEMLQSLKLNSTDKGKSLKVWTNMYAESDGVNPAQGVDLGVRTTEQPVTDRRREPPPPYSPRQEPASDVVTTQPIVHQTVIVQASLKGNPIFYDCPQCQDRVLTKVKYVNSRKTHLLAGFICGFTCWCLICCLGALPYVLKTFKKAEHYCPNCEKHLGTYSKI